jgi:hypothetical protein
MNRAWSSFRRALAVGVHGARRLVNAATSNLAAKTDAYSPGLCANARMSFKAREVQRRDMISVGGPMGCVVQRKKAVRSMISVGNLVSEQGWVPLDIVDVRQS